ncbi:MAG: sulfite exporter TauE/SafE family protein [Candidatus Omnitrophica bacterium]|nr:sulfite exporter TauE/SafE family protein [Candidatus Omnitrophota bacterium]MDE2221461.1 sulfite exporter TauE/SafE family protein [Candidatus Omnitrophota bacterium]
MNTLEFTLLIGLGSVLAGLVGVLTGLGGGVVIVPMLTLVFGVDIRYAIGASLVSVIATSSSAAATYIKEGYSNLRVGMFLEIATTLGALSGAFLALIISPRLIAVVFGLALLHSAYTSWQEPKEFRDNKHDPLSRRLRMDSSYPDSGGLQYYHVHNIPGGFLLMMVAGALSGLLGIGSGALKVIAMDRIMKIPFKVSTTTSNFMIGVTAAASAGIYLNRGYIDPGLAMPVMLGVLIGASTGSHFLMKSKTKSLRTLFGTVILVLAVEMIFNGIKGNFR